MTVRQYVGARYVPKFYEFNNGVWQSNTEYEPLTIVQYNGNSYTSKKPVPANIGNPSENGNYWVATGNYNAQVEQYRQEVVRYKEEFDNLSIIDIKNYGAVCDGLTDDTAAFNNALADSENKVLLLHGTILISSALIIGNNRIIEGNNSTIKVSSNFSGGLVSTNLFIFNSNNTIFRNLKIDGSNFNTLNAAIILNDADNILIENVEISNVYGRNIWVRDNNNNITIKNCYVHDGCTLSAANGTGAICSAFNGEAVNSNIYFENCRAVNCGHAGFEMLDVSRGYILNCISEQMSGSAGNWETANGFNIGSNCIVTGCLVKECSNTGFYVTGSNNSLTSITVAGSGGTGIDFYTGGGSGANNVVDGALLLGCSTTAHPNQYDHAFIIGGTNQNVISISDVVISSGGNTSVPIYPMDFDSFVGCIIDNINIFNVTNVANSLRLRGVSNNNIIRNSRLDSDILEEGTHSNNIFENNYGMMNGIQALDITLGTAYTNNTGRTMVITVEGGTVTEIALNNVLTGFTSGSFIVPHGWLFQINGSVLPNIKRYFI